MTICLTLHDGDPYHVETSPLIYIAYQWTGFYMIGTSVIKGCVRYIFAGLFCMSKRQHLRNKEKFFLFHFKSSSRS